MEIEKIAKANIFKVSRKDTKASPSVSFTEVMAKRSEELALERFQQLVQQIEDQGKVLAESRSVEDLRKYKKLVKTLLDDAVKNGLQLSEQHGFNWSGRSRLYKIVKEVDQKLIDLTNAVLQKEKQSIDLLSTIGEIQGLIINIYT
ncbi:YaaR family protein [Thermaerobacillus caldiproteolyticus]|uniref:YaaR family protein n=1 Tax=Thermaerobacillus caldiproteolyticus TaxID=247480 RepID=UPI00188D6343|nr:YaaR family protein [Anoxybacillus caldiproteolyticus]QPA30720.1 YaaR family protein [Anoxybacillus caldiproteolyticus]